MDKIQGDKKQILPPDGRTGNVILQKGMWNGRDCNDHF